ncbi:zinc-binding dehydrogenase [Streptomyces sp. NPDC127084]|uniref:zinc-dependent alcohol dehydrogenase n=1 Tax=Streptomyces sp. NPDC127084 TaxID=3347133 RepID=UPI00364F15B3
MEDPPFGGLLLEVTANGICGTDAHFFAMEPMQPLVLGHEIVGGIVATGTDFTGFDSAGVRVGIGDTIALFPWVPCGQCWGCRRFGPGATTCTQAFVYGIPPEAIGAPPSDTAITSTVRLTGGFGRHLIVRRGTWFWRVPDGISPAVASLLDPLAVALRSLDVTRTPTGTWDEVLAPDSSAVVMGLGAVGLMTVLALRRCGVGTIVASGSRHQRLAAAEHMGTDAVLDTRSLDREARRRKVFDITAGRGADLVVDATNSPAAFSEALSLARRLGTVVEVGNVVSEGVTTPIDVARDVCQKSVRIIGVTFNPPQSYREASALLSDRTLPFEKLITATRPLKRAGTALDDLSGDVIKLVVSGE